MTRAAAAAAMVVAGTAGTPQLAIRAVPQTPAPVPLPTAAGLPAIVAARVVPSPVRPGEPVEADVSTSPDVTSVVASVRGMHFTLQPVGPGEFRMSGHVPRIARFFRGRYRVTFVASCAKGRTETETDVVVN